MAYSINKERSHKIPQQKEGLLSIMEQDLDNLYGNHNKGSLSDSSEEETIRKKVKRDRNASPTMEVQDHNNASDLEDIEFFQQTDYTTGCADTFENDFSEWVPPHLARSKLTSTQNPPPQPILPSQDSPKNTQNTSFPPKAEIYRESQSYKYPTQSASESQNKENNNTSSATLTQLLDNKIVPVQTFNKEKVSKPLPTSGIAKKSGKGAPPRHDRPVTEPKEVIIHDIPLSDNPISAPRRPVAPPKTRVTLTKTQLKTTPQPQTSSQGHAIQGHKAIPNHSVPIFSKPTLPSYMIDQLNPKQTEAYLSIKRPLRVSDVKLFQQSTPQELKEFITKELETGEQDEQEEISIQQLINKYTERNKYRTVTGLRLHESFDQVETKGARVINYPANYRYFL